MPTPRVHTDRAAKQRAYRKRTKQALAEQLAAKNLPTTAPIPTMPSTARWKALQEQAQAALQAIVEEMEAYQADRSDQWQESDRAGQFQDTLDAVEEARSAVAELVL